MNTLFNLTYPLFVPSQTLRSSDLNNLRFYLEEQDRATRAALIGAGVICGLKPYCKTEGDQTVLCITPGAGASSSGYLFMYEAEGTDALDSYKKTSVNRGIFTGDPNDLTPIEVCEYFKKDTNAGADVLPVVAELKTKVILLHCTLVEIPNKSCLGKLDPGGDSAGAVIKVYGIDKAALAPNGLWVPGQNTDPAKYTDFPCIRRVPHKPLIKHELHKYEWLMGQWADSIDAAIDEVAAALEKVLGATAASQWKNKVNAAKLPWFPVPVTDKILSANLQYLYDHIRDVICAYNEMAEVRVTSGYYACCGDLNFPKYITLGIPVTDLAAEPDVRMPFYKAGKSGENTSVERFKALKERLLAIMENCAITPLLPKKNKAELDVRISGSGAKSRPLGEQAIPFYYPDALREKWNPELFVAGRSDVIQHYEQFPSLTGGISIKYPRQALLKEVGKYDFFRIEGHLGALLKDGFLAVQELRDKLNLPFDITCVRLGDLILPTDADEELECVLNQLSFDTFCADHPGLEHFGGVPKGGTFVLVYSDMIDTNIGNDFIFDPNNSNNILISVDKAAKRCIVADFCLPYSCFKAPQVQYNFLEICAPVADFECVDIDYFEKSKLQERLTDNEDLLKKIIELESPVVRLQIENRSGAAVTTEWFINDTKIVTGLELGSDTGIVVFDGNAAGGWTGYFSLQKIQELTIRLRLESQPFDESIAEKVIDLCPKEMYLSIWRDVQLGGEMEIGGELELDLGKVNPLQLRYAPPGGSFRVEDTLKAFLSKDLSAEISNDQPINVVFADPNFQVPPGIYSIWYNYPDPCKLQREVRLIVSPSPGARPADPDVPGDEEGILKEAEVPVSVPVALLNKRRNTYWQNCEAVADNKLGPTTAYRRTMSALMSPFDAAQLSGDVENWESLVKSLLGNMGKSGGASDAQYATLLMNTTWHLLDKLVNAGAGTIPAYARSAFDAAVPAMKKAGIKMKALRDGWNADELNAPVTEAYLKLMK
jgi:hypothetical protein